MRFLRIFLAVLFLFPPGGFGLGRENFAQAQILSQGETFVPPLLKGLKIFTDDPFRFDFMVDKGQTDFNQDALRVETERLIKYFLAVLTIPDQDLWVNLSPYEKDRIMPESLAMTEMGRDLLKEDYFLKQMTASLLYPEKELGQKFWQRVYSQAQRQYGTTQIPTDTFHKVWIVPGSALVYEHEDRGFVVESQLNVMLEEDYMVSRHLSSQRAFPQKGSEIATQVLRQIILPELKREVNEGKLFVKLRQIYHSMILATWFKKKLKDSILSRAYVGKNKIDGIDVDDKYAREKIYEQYLQAFKKGAYRYIREEIDPATQQLIPRKYFAGGGQFGNMGTALKITRNPAAGKRFSQPASGGQMVEASALLRTHDRLRELVMEDENLQAALREFNAENSLYSAMELWLRVLEDQGLLEMDEVNNPNGHVEVKILPGARAYETGRRIYEEVVRPLQDQVGFDAVNFPSSKNGRWQGRWLIVGFEEQMNDPDVIEHDREESRRLEAIWNRMHADGTFTAQSWAKVQAQTHNEVVRAQGKGVLISGEVMAEFEKHASLTLPSASLKDWRERLGRLISGRRAIAGEASKGQRETPAQVVRSVEPKVGANSFTAHFAGEIEVAIHGNLAPGVEQMMAVIQVEETPGTDGKGEPTYTSTLQLYRPDGRPLRVPVLDRRGQPVMEDGAVKMKNAISTADASGQFSEQPTLGLGIAVIPGKNGVHRLDVVLIPSAHHVRRVDFGFQVGATKDFVPTREGDYRSSPPAEKRDDEAAPEAPAVAAAKVEAPREVEPAAKPARSAQFTLLPQLLEDDSDGVDLSGVPNPTEALFALGHEGYPSPVAEIVLQEVNEEGRPRYTAHLRSGRLGYAVVSQPFEENFGILDIRTGRLFNFWIEAGMIHYQEHHPKTLETVSGVGQQPLGRMTVYYGLEIEVTVAANQRIFSAFVVDAGSVPEDSLKKLVYIEWTPGQQVRRLGKAYGITALDRQPFIGSGEIHDHRRGRSVRFQLDAEKGKGRFWRYDLATQRPLDDREGVQFDLGKPVQIYRGLILSIDPASTTGAEAFSVLLNEVPLGAREDQNGEVVVNWYEPPSAFSEKALVLPPEERIVLNQRLLLMVFSRLQRGEDFPTDNVLRFPVQLDENGVILNQGENVLRSEETLDVAVRAKDYGRKSWGKAKFWLDEKDAAVLQRLQQKQQQLAPILHRGDFQEYERRLDDEDFTNEERSRLAAVGKDVINQRERVMKKRDLLDSWIETERERRRVMDFSLREASREYEERLLAEADFTDDEKRLIAAVAMVLDEDSRSDGKAGAVALLQDDAKPFEFNEDLAGVYAYYKDLSFDQQVRFVAALQFLQRALAAQPDLLQRYFGVQPESAFSAINEDHRALYAFGNWTTRGRMPAVTVGARRAEGRESQTAPATAQVRALGYEVAAVAPVEMRGKPVAEKKVDEKEKVGGIALDSALLDLQTQGHIRKFQLPSDSQILIDGDFDGLVPVVFQITPVVNVRALLGLEKI